MTVADRFNRLLAQIAPSEREEADYASHRTTVARAIAELHADEPAEMQRVEVRRIGLREIPVGLQGLFQTPGAMQFDGGLEALLGGAPARLAKTTSHHAPPTTYCRALDTRSSTGRQSRSAPCRNSFTDPYHGLSSRSNSHRQQVS